MKCRHRSYKYLQLQILEAQLLAQGTSINRAAQLDADNQQSQLRWIRVADSSKQEVESSI